MLEIMIGGGGGALGYHPYSGPGNKHMLAGNKVSGWFGMVEVDQMPSLPQIATQFNLAYTPYTGPNTIAPYWLKARLKDKYVLIPNGGWSAQLSFQSLYNAGLIYGVDGTPPVPSGLTAVNQLSYFEWTDPTGRNWLFKVRALESSTVHQAAVTTDVTTESILDSENAILFSHIATGGAPNDLIPWDNLNAPDNPYRFQSFWFWTTTYIPNGKVMAGYHATTSSVVANWYPYNETFTWLPVLEVMSPDDGLVIPFKVQTMSTAGSGVTTGVDTTRDVGLNLASDVMVNNARIVPVTATGSDTGPVYTASLVTTANAGVSPINPLLT